MAKKYTENIGARLVGSDPYKYDTKGKSIWTRFVQALNSVLNPNHSWFDYSTWKDSSEGAIDNWLAGATGSGLTAAEKATNQFNSEEADKQRQWEEQMQNTAYQRQVADMQKAGINPALAMSNGQPSIPSGASAQATSPSMSGISMSDLMQLFLIPGQRKLLDAQAKATLAGADKSRAEIGEIEGRTEQLRLINAYYPQVTEAQLDKYASELGLTRGQIRKANLESALLVTDNIIKRAEADHASAFYKARVEYQEAQTKEAKANAAASAARAAWDEFETNWTRTHNGARPSASGVLALVGAITSWLGMSDDGDDSNDSGTVVDVVKDKAAEAGSLISDPVGHIDRKGKEIDSRLSRIGSAGKRFVKRLYFNSRTKYGLK